LQRMRPRDPQVLTGLANALARIGQFNEALIAVTEAVRLDPRDAVARAASGSLLMQLGRPEEAVPQLEVAQALVDNGGDWVERDVERLIEVNLGWAYASVGRNEDGLRVLRQAAADDDVSALNNLGSVLARLGQWDEARQILERAHRREPGDPNVQSNLGWVYANLGRLGEADALLESAILQQPQEASAHGNLGWVRLRAGDPAGALQALSMAQRLQPDNAWVANMIGVAYAELGEWDSAIRAFERAASLAPDAQLAQENLGRARAHEVPLLAVP